MTTLDEVRDELAKLNAASAAGARAAAKLIDALKGLDDDED